MTLKEISLCLLVLALAAAGLMLAWRLATVVEDPVFRSLFSVSAALAGFVVGSVIFWEVAKRTPKSDTTEEPGTSSTQDLGAKNDWSSSQ